jgi:nitrite reductase/ring-hydroxylating ferredoxin subunit
MDQYLTRRRLIRQFILGSAASWCAGVWKTETVLASVAPPMMDLITLKLRPASFPALNDIGGSVQLNVGLEQPVVISRASAGRFHTVNSRCAHLGCTVNIYNSSTRRITCPCHGSSYNIDGSLAGGPATEGLQAYETAFDGVEQITVWIPGGSFAARDISVESSNGDGHRIKLTFFPTINTSYQVHYRADLSDIPQVIPFSLTPTGGATRTVYRNTVYNPSDPAPLVPLYVDTVAPRGFLSISLVVTPY